MLASSMLDRLGYYMLILVTIPLLVFGLLIGLAEALICEDARIGQWIASPFMRAVKRRRFG